MKTELKYLMGFWREYVNENYTSHPLAAQLPSIKDASFDRSQIDSRILEYLWNNENVWSALRGGETQYQCFWREGQYVSSSIYFTDGVYIWNNMLVKYYQDMGIVLPTEFINHVVLHNYSPLQMEIDMKIKIIDDFELAYGIFISMTC